MQNATERDDSVIPFAAPQSLGRATKLAKKLRDIIADRFALKVPLQACQDAVAVGAGRSNYNDFQKHVAKGRPVGPWSAGRAVERLARRVSAEVAAVAVGELMSQPWALGGQLVFDLRIVTGPYGRAVELAPWQDRFAQLVSSGAFMDFAVDLAAYEAEEHTAGLRDEQVADLYADHGSAFRDRLRAALAALAARPSHAAWPALALAALTGETFGGGHDDRERDDFHVWHQFAHALDDYDPAHLSELLGRGGGAFGQFVADAVSHSLVIAVAHILEEDPEIDFAAIPDLPFRPVRSRPQVTGETLKARAAEEDGRPFWLPGQAIAHYAGADADLPLGAWVEIEDAPAEAVAQTRESAKKVTDGRLEWMKVVFVSFGPTAETAVRAAGLTIAKYADPSVDYAAAYFAPDYAAYAPWEENELTEGALAAAVVSLLRRDAEGLAGSARASGRPPRIMMDLRCFATPRIHDAVTGFMGSKPMPSDYEERLHQRRH